MDSGFATGNGRRIDVSEASVRQAGLRLMGRQGRDVAANVSTATADPRDPGPLADPSPGADRSRGGDPDATVTPRLSSPPPLPSANDAPPADVNDAPPADVGTGPLGTSLTAPGPPRASFARIPLEASSADRSVPPPMLVPPLVPTGFVSGGGTGKQITISASKLRAASTLIGGEDHSGARGTGTGTGSDEGAAEGGAVPPPSVTGPGLVPDVPLLGMDRPGGRKRGAEGEADGAPRRQVSWLSEMHATHVWLICYIIV